MSGITTHVLDTALGKPAASVPVVLEMRESGQWIALGRGATDFDGRLLGLTPAGFELAPAEYRLTFDTSVYFARTSRVSFYPKVVVHFEVRDAGAHYHVPLLLSPFGYSTYRGS
jgi:5-hydroxyisourate hydrolase